VIKAHLSVRAEARCSVPKIVQIRSIAENATASAAVFDPQNKKARPILADLSGCLANAKPATLMVWRISRNMTRHQKINHLSVGIATAHLRG
jgi:hypothetical protein